MRVDAPTPTVGGARWARKSIVQPWLCATDARSRPRPAHGVPEGARLRSRAPAGIRETRTSSALGGPTSLGVRLAAAAEEGRVDLSDLGRGPRRLLATTTPSSNGGFLWPCVP